jgi:hypothetical protein
MVKTLFFQSSLFKFPQLHQPIPILNKRLHSENIIVAIRKGKAKQKSNCGIFFAIDVAIKQVAGNFNETAQY